RTRTPTSRPPPPRGSRRSRAGCASSPEHHRLVLEHEDAVLEVPADGACQHGALEVAALAQQVRDRIAVRRARDVLLDDRAFVEVGGGVVRGGADQLDAALLRLVVRLAALEGG